MWHMDQQQVRQNSKPGAETLHRSSQIYSGCSVAGGDGGRGWGPSNSEGHSWTQGDSIDTLVLQGQVHLGYFYSFFFLHASTHRFPRVDGAKT